jgi:hypothetical protein
MTGAGKGTVTVARIDRAMKTVARAMLKHDMPELRATLDRLKAEREWIQRETSAMDYAIEILRQKDATQEATPSKAA